MTPPEWLVLAGTGLAVYALAAVAQAVTGFGSALVAVPLLAFVVDPTNAVVATTIVSGVLSAWSFRTERPYADGPALRTLVLSGAVGIPFGLFLLVVLGAGVLRLLIGSVVLVLVVLLAAGRRLPSGRGALRVAGTSSGALLSSTGLNGPPLVLVLAGHQPRVARATLQGVFAVQDLIAVAGFACLGRLSGTAAGLAVAGVVVVPLGWWIGDRLFHRLRPVHARWIVLAGLAVSGGLTVAQSL